MSQFMTQFHGPLYGVLLLPQWDELTGLLASRNDSNWYVYYVGETVPTAPLATGQFQHFLDEIGELLRRDHQEEYLGIVYADNLEEPSFIKIYDPNNLGASCGSSGSRVLPGWVISRAQPVDLRAEFPNPGARRRWWQTLFNRDDVSPATSTSGGHA